MEKLCVNPQLFCVAIGGVNVNQAHHVNTIDTELVNALEKLVDLKQEGFLTQEEFVKAKENLMRNLFNTNRIN